MYLVRERLSWKRDLAVTAAGPVAPGLLAAVSLFGFRAWPLHTFATLAIWIKRVLLLAMPGGDGRSLRHALREAVGRERDSSGRCRIVTRSGQPDPDADPA